MTFSRRRTRNRGEIASIGVLAGSRRRRSHSRCAGYLGLGGHFCKKCCKGGEGLEVQCDMASTRRANGKQVESNLGLVG